MKNYAYCTLVGNDEYVWGGILTAYSSNLVGNKYPMVILVADDCSEATKQLIKNCPYAIYKEIPSLKFFSCPDTAIDRFLLKRYAATRGKLEPWNLTEYDRIIFLDADCIFLTNADNTFEYFDTFNKENLFMGKEGNPQKNILTYIEGCVMFLTPNHKDYLNLQNIAETTVGCYTDEECTSRYFNNDALDKSYFEPAAYRTGNSTSIFNFFNHMAFRPKAWVVWNINSYEKIKEVLPTANSAQNFFLRTWAKIDDPCVHDDYLRFMAMQKSLYK